MAIITADMQYQPQQEIVRDISIMQVASKTPKKSSKSGKDKKTKEEQEIREYIIRQCEDMYLRAVSQYAIGSSAAQWAAQQAQQEITGYLKSLNHPIADQILKEYRAQWKKR